MFKFFQNAKEEPKIFYCKHIAPGVCAYEDETILIGEEALKGMDKTFAGKPIYVNHQKVNLENLQEEADGYVAESFYLPEDGCHWAKMIIVSDKGQEAIRKGWKVSNAYVPDEFGIGGEWHNVPYNREIMKAHYTHLALVDNPRYEEAEVMTPEQFKMYKEEKKAQLKELENTKGEGKTMFKLFKKTAVNSDDLSKVMVELSNGSTVSIGEMVNSVEADLKKEEEEKNKYNEADVLEKVVKVNGEDMTVADLIKEYEGKCNKCNEDEEKKPEAEEEKKDADEEPKEEPKAEEPEEAKEDKKNEDVDKRELIRQIMAIAGEAGASEEQVRTIAEKCEELAYDKDEAKEDKKNEEPEEEVKEDLTVEDKENVDPEFMKKAQPLIEEGKKKGLSGKALDEYVMEHLDAKQNAKALLEAEEKANMKGFQGQVVDTMSRRLARGQERYGSAK